MPRRQVVSPAVCLLGVLMLLGLVSLAALGSKTTPPAPPPFPGEPGQVRLVVLVVFDQMRGDYQMRWRDLFVPDGFRRLQDEGAWFQNCHYPYSVTKTGPGHASLLSGCSPNTHGIISNDWYDRASGKQVNCVGSERHERVPPVARRWNWEKGSSGASPERLLAPALGDALKEASGGAARVVSLSFKDRSAILPAGKRPDACYWFDPAGGVFVTSTYYRDRVHRWVDAFNRGRVAERFYKPWEPLYPALDYARLCAPRALDDNDDGAPLQPRFAHPFSLLYLSPHGNELLLDLAKRAIVAEDLGRRPAPDLLCLSFSCNDPIGHRWGPDSQEVLDVTLRSDLIIKELLEFLDVRVGVGRYLLALSADHGVCPIPEQSRARGMDVGRVPIQLLSTEANEFLQKTFGKEGEKTRWVEGTSEPWIYLNRAVLRARGLEAGRVETALARWLEQQPGVLRACTRTELLLGPTEGDALGQAVRRSFHPERSGDVAVVVKPYYLFSPPLGLNTNHGTPHAYDTHVPLLVYGPGVCPGIRTERVTPQAIAPIFARALHILPPSRSEAPFPESLMEVTESAR